MWSRWFWTQHAMRLVELLGVSCTTVPRAENRIVQKKKKNKEQFCIWEHIGVNEYWRTFLRRQEGYDIANKDPLQSCWAEKHVRLDIKPYRSWATTAEDHVRHHFHQPRTGIQRTPFIGYFFATSALFYSFLFFNLDAAWCTIKSCNHSIRIQLRVTQVTEVRFQRFAIMYDGLCKTDVCWWKQITHCPLVVLRDGD